MTTNQTHEVLTGICTCCLGRFVVENNRPVLHGYRRPGDGVTHGRCNGMQFLAYEISPQGCKVTAEQYRRTATRLRNRAAQLRAGQITTIERRVSKYRSSGLESNKISFTPESSREDFRCVGYFCWKDLVEAVARNAEHDAKSADHHAEEFQDMVDAWKPGLEFISEARLDADKKAVAEAKRAEAQFKRNCKRNKALFFHIGAAISKHKKGWLHASWDWKDSPAYQGIPRLAPFAEIYPAAKKGRK